MSTGRKPWSFLPTIPTFHKILECSSCEPSWSFLGLLWTSVQKTNTLSNFWTIRSSKDGKRRATSSWWPMSSGLLCQVVILITSWSSKTLMTRKDWIRSWKCMLKDPRFYGRATTLCFGWKEPWALSSTKFKRNSTTKPTLRTSAFKRLKQCQSPSTWPAMRT